MTFASKTAGLASTIALALALVACGGGAEDTAEPAVEATEAALPAAESTAAPAAEDTGAPGATPSESPSPTPTPSASASASAGPVAMAEPAAYAVCKACHSVEPGKNGIGPSLAGVFGERAGTQPGFDFSDAMKNSGLVLNQSGLDRYLADPKGVVPGTKMAFGGVKDAAKRQAIIDYIKSL